MSKDEEHLRLLVVFHYVVAGLTALFSLFPLIHLFLGIAMIHGRFGTAGGSNAPPEELGWFFIAIAVVIITCGMTLAILIALGGRALQRRRNRMFCLAVAGLSCILMPFGTVLGIFTILVLSRDSVRLLFEESDGSSAAR